MTGLTHKKTDPKAISFEWVELTDATLNGGDIPISYSVEHSTDNSTWTVLNPGSTTAEFIYTHSNPEPFIGAST